MTRKVTAPKGSPEKKAQRRAMRERLAAHPEPAPPERKYSEEAEEGILSSRNKELNQFYSLLYELGEDDKLSESANAPMMLALAAQEWVHIARVARSIHDGNADSSSLNAFVNSDGKIVARRGGVGAQVTIRASQLLDWLDRKLGQVTITGEAVDAGDVELELVEGKPGVKLRVGLFKIRVSEENAEELRGLDPVARSLGVAELMNAKGAKRVPNGADWEAALAKLSQKIVDGW